MFGLSTINSFTLDNGTKNMNYESKFAQRFTELLENHKMTQVEFGKKYGFSKTRVNNWCKGPSEPPLKVIVMICKEFGEEADWLIGVKDL